MLLVLLPLSALIAAPRLFKQSSLSSRPARRLNYQALAALLVRWALLTTLILALAGLQAVQFTNRLAVVFLIDASDSVGPDGVERAAQFVRDALRTMRSDGQDQAAVVVFGADAQVERVMSAMRDLPPIGSQVRSAGTNIEGAIRLGISLFPAEAAKRLVLLSDGLQTIGDAAEAARLAGASDIRLDVVPLPSVQGPDAAVERVDAPQRVVAGQVIPLNIAIRSNRVMRAQLTVFSGAEVVAQELVNLTNGMNEFVVRVSAPQAGFSAFRAQVAPEADAQPQNNALAAAVIVDGPSRILLVSPPPDSSAGVDEVGALKRAFDVIGISYDETSPRVMPSEIQSLASYQAVVMANAPARDLSPRAMDAIQSYVRDIGGGLVVLGGPSSYGVGGYYQTPLEETLPVEMQVKDPKRFPSVSIVVVMDKSGSMSLMENGVMKMRLAAEAAARVAELVNDDDELTVIGFDTEPVDVIGPFAGRDRRKYINQILSIAPGGGGIYVYESLKEAEKIITRSSKQTKFIILLADGNDAERQEGVRELVRQMRADHNVTLTVVAFGDGADIPFLKSIAEIGGGRYHFTDRAANLPTIFTEEAALAQRSYIVEQNVFPRLGANSPIMSGITAMPALRGYIASTPKPAAQVILWASESDPLLAAWQYGLGRAVAFTSDATGRWAKDWVTWRDFPKFWAQAIRWTILERPQSPIQIAIQPRDERTVIAAELPEAYLDERLELAATLIDADGRARILRMDQVSPGRYEVEADLEQAGAYFVRVAPAGEGVARLTEAIASYARPYSPEYTVREGGGANLRAWAALANGDVLESPAQAFALNAPATMARTDLFPLLLALAALLLPFDVGVRRIAANLRRQRAEQPAPTNILPAPAQTGRQLQAKMRASAPRMPQPGATAEAASSTAAELLKRRQQRAEEQGG